MNCEVRSAKATELEWVNERYDEVEFVHSTYDNEIIAIAEVDGQKAGIGRLVMINNKNLELGGMYVFESFRGKGIAAQIVKFLLENTLSDCTIFCIPFQQLEAFYQKHGFASCHDLEQVPQELLKKYLWCKKKYSQPVSLLFLKKNA